LSRARNGPERPSTLLRGLIIGACVILTGAAAVWAWESFASAATPRWIGLAAITLCALTALMLSHYVVRRRVLVMLRDANRRADGGPSSSRGERESGALGHLARVVDSLALRVATLSESIRAIRAEKAAILGSMAGGVLVLDCERRIIDLNPAGESMLGIGIDHARGKLLHEVVRQPDLHRLVESALAGAPDGGEDLTLSGAPARRVRATVNSVINSEGRLSGLLVVLNDITQLRRLERLRTDFAANVSHELRTPITNIKGYIETLLESRLTDREQSLEFLRVIARNADRLSAIIEDMLMLTQLERSDARDSLELVQTDLAPVIESVVNEAERAANAKGMHIEIEVEGDVLVRANAPLLQQAIGNLLGNAIKYSPPQSRVWIRAAQIDGSDAVPKVRIDVVDEGPGIAESHVARLFERFYRVDRARSREQGGTGLGLAIVKHIAEVHSGRVEVASALGHGSTFSLFIPAAGPATSAGVEMSAELRPVLASRDLDTI